MSELYLIHHGILGQKHGVQNGPPYPLDKSKYSYAEKKALKKANKLEKKKRKNLNKNRRLLSDEELDEYNRRLEKEKQLNKNLTSDDVYTSGKEAAKKSINDIGGKVVAAVAVPALIYVGTEAVGKALGNPDVGKQIWKKFITPKK